MRIAMIGCGYVGLVSGACFADFGHQVVAVDSDPSRIAALRGLQIPIFEPGLAELVATNVKGRRLAFTSDLDTAVTGADIVFLAVGTPSRHGDGYADLSFIYRAAQDIAPFLSPAAVVAIKSTVPVGTGDEVERTLRAAGAPATVMVVSNPEFMREGSAIDDFKIPDRVVIGANEDRARTAMAELYRPLNLNRAPLFFTDRRTAEILKYASNAFLAMKITFINEMADLCERVGADVQDVATGMGLDNRIGRKFLHAGPGYGGSCFPKDTVALIRTSEEAGSPLRLIEATVASNELRKRAMARKIIAALPDGGRGARVAILGLTFKPNTDDMREAPSLAIIPMLQAAGVTVVAHDPQGTDAARALLSDLTFADGPYQCAEGADAVVILTEWDAFRSLDFGRLSAVMKGRTLIDLRNVYRRAEVVRHGFRHVTVGRGEDAGLPSELIRAAAE